MKALEKVKEVLLKRLDLFVIEYHVLMGLYMSFTTIDNGEVGSIFWFIGFAIAWALILLKIVKVLNWEEHKLKLFGIEIIVSLYYFFDIVSYTYSVKTFAAFVLTMLGIYFISINKYLVILPILSGIASFLMPEYVFSYFQILLFILMLQCKEKDKALRNSVITSYVLQIIAGYAGGQLFETQPVGLLLPKALFMFCDASLVPETGLVFVVLSGCVVYIYKCLEGRAKFRRILCMLPLAICGISTLFLRDSHIMITALCVMSFGGFFLLKKESIGEKLGVIKDNLVAFLVCVIGFKLICCLDAELISRDVFVVCPYYFNYFHFGFLQRSLVGTLFYLLLGYDISKMEVWTAGAILYHSSFIILLVLMYAIYKYYTKSKNDDGSVMTKILPMLYVASTACISYLNPGLVFRFDLYNMVLTVACVYLIMKNRFLLMVPVLCAAALMNHQVFVFIAFPIIFIAFTYRVFIDSEGRFKRNLFAYAMMLITVCGLFVYFQFFSQAFAMISGDEAIQIINDRSGGTFANNAYFDGKYSIIKTVVFADLDTHVGTFQNEIDTVQIITAIFLAIYLLPLFAMFFYSFFKTAMWEESRFKRLVYRLMPFSILAILPTYILETDYGRWNQHLVAILLLSLLAFTFMQKKEQKWYKELTEKKLTIWVAIVYLMVVAIPAFSFY